MELMSPMRSQQRKRPAKLIAPIPETLPPELIEEILASVAHLRVFLAPPGFSKELCEEITRGGGSVVLARGELVIAKNTQARPAWAQVEWLQPVFQKLESIQDMQKFLRSQAKSAWVNAPTIHHRRASLIAGALPSLKSWQLEFSESLPKLNFGSWALLDRNFIVASLISDHPLPLGAAPFAEDKSGPPSRAYLKLWELFTLWQFGPDPGDSCLDLGASPGGWTWVLQEMGCQVTAVDKAPLDKSLAANKEIKFRKASAFSLEPRDQENDFTWLFSDVICYPERLYQFVERWLRERPETNFVCTLKFQGPTDFATMEKFRALTPSLLVHLAANKHELTWVYLGGQPVPKIC